MNYARMAGTETALLSLRGIRVEIGGRTLFERIDIDIPARGVTALLGACGTGKSSLLALLCGAPTAARRVPRLGTARYDGRALRPTHRPALVAQFAGRPMTDNEIKAAHAVLSRAGVDAWAWPVRVTDRLLAIGAALMRDPAMICIDEPTAGLDDYESAPILALIEEEGKHRALVVVTHNQDHARMFADSVVLLAGARVAEHSPAALFFDVPATDEGRRFLRHGTSVEPSPDTPRHMLSPEFRKAPDEILVGRGSVAPADFGPPGFTWVIDGMLAHAHRPGGARTLQQDLDALRRVGVTTLISFAADADPATDAIVAAGLAPFAIPIQADETPTPEIGDFYCAEIDRLLDSDQVVAVHGGDNQDVAAMMLAAQLVRRGFSAGDALSRVRERTRAMISSVLQEQFVWDLELFCDLKTAAASGEAPVFAGNAVGGTNVASRV